MLISSNVIVGDGSSIKHWQGYVFAQYTQPDGTVAITNCIDEDQARWWLAGQAQPGCHVVSRHDAGYVERNYDGTYIAHKPAPDHVSMKHFDTLAQAQAWLTGQRVDVQYQQMELFA